MAKSNAKPKRARRITSRAARQVNNTSPTSRSNAHARLSKPASDYARAVVNPFDGPICSYPDLPVIPTRKERYWIKGSAVTNNSGKGYLLFNPFTGFCNDKESVYVSSASSAESDAFPASTVATGVVGYKSNSPFASSAFDGKNFAMKLVTAGCRIRYTGKYLDRSGVYVALHEPSHQGLMGKTSTDLLGYPEGKKVSIQDHKDWFGCTYLPVDLGDTKFINKYGVSVLAPPANAWWSDSTEVQYQEYPFMGIIISTASGASVSFDYECSVVVEVIGKNVTGKTPSLADPVGLAAIQTAATQHPHAMIHHGANAESHAQHGALQQLTHMVSTIGQGIQGLSGVTQSVQTLISAPKKNESSSTIWDTLDTIWKGVSTVAPILSAILL